jgi:TolB-like protein/DNA-binding winged helix-turn-helix (wHTH) protein/Flp pilus assembly protein TadD
MQGAHHPLGRVAFEPYEVDFQTGELRKHGIRIRLQAQPFQVLEMLLERPGALVTREELKRKLWPADSFGDFDHGLNKAINKIREALADSALHPRYVETVARRGYRFIAIVRAADEPLAAVEPMVVDVAREIKGDNEARAAQPLPPRRLPKTSSFKVAVAFVTAVFAVVLVWKLHPRAHASSNIQSLAVLPLENLSNDVSQEYFADGMTDELITALGSINGLRVISRSSVILYKRVRRPLPQIARELNVDAVVEGTVLRSGEQVRITAQLIRATTDEHLWAESYEGDLRDTLQLQDRVARAIANRIRVNVTSREQVLLQNPKPINPVAYDAYLRGRYFWNKRTEQGLRKAIEYFDQAIANDPKYAQAYSGLADSYALLGDWEYGALAPQEAFPKAEAAATKALELNDNLGEAHASLALCLKAFDWDWKGADRELSRAIKLSPSYATAHQWYAWNLIITGRNNEGIIEMKKAEAIDPLSLIISADVADALIIAHRYDESIRQSRRTIEMDPSFAMAHYQLGQAFVQIRKYKQAAMELQEAIELSRGNPICSSLLAYVYAISGNDREARKILNDLRNGSNRNKSNAANIALIYAGLNDKDQAFAWLQKAYEARFNPSVLLRPAFDVLRSDPRFQDLLRRLNLSWRVASQVASEFV